MIKLLLKSVTYIVILYLLAYAWQNIVDKGLKQSFTYGHLYADWDSIYKGGADTEMLIMGSSRAAIQVNPTLMEDSLKQTCFNIGIDGHKFLTQYYKFMLYLKHNKAPKTILLNLDILGLIHTKDFFNYEQFIPYLNDTIIRNIVKPQPLFNWKDFYVPMVKFTHRKDMVFDGTYAYFKPYEVINPREKGFKSVSKDWDSLFVKKALELMYIDGYEAKIDSATKQLFEKFIFLCKEKNIKLIFVYPPEYKDNLHYCLNRSTIINYYKHIANKEHITFLDYSNSYLCNDKRMFFDSQHLNTKGVSLFNNQLIKDLKLEMNSYGN